MENSLLVYVLEIALQVSNQRQVVLRQLKLCYLKFLCLQLLQLFLGCTILHIQKDLPELALELWKVAQIAKHKFDLGLGVVRVHAPKKRHFVVASLEAVFLVEQLYQE